MQRYAVAMIGSVFMLLLVVGCGNDEESAAPAEQSMGTHVSENESPPLERARIMTEVSSPSITISAAESARHEMPSAAISLNTGKKHMSGRTFPEKGYYVRLSGPPGAPLGMVVEHVSHIPADDAAWRQMIEPRYSERSAKMGSTAEVEISGGMHRAFTFTTDEGFARAHHLAIAIPVPDSDEGLLVDFWHAAGDSETPTPDAMLADGGNAGFLRSLSVQFQ